MNDPVPSPAQSARNRCFVGVFPAPCLASAIERLQRQLRTGLAGAPVRWTRSDQWHLTLVFLGPVETGRLPELSAGLHTLGPLHGPFRLRLSGMGAFPDARRPRVIWAGLAEATGALARLQAGVEAITGPFAEDAEERPFHPHLTLGRVGGDRSAGLRIARALAHGAGPEEAGGAVEEFCLMRSELGPGGSRYTVLTRVRLTGPGPGTEA